MTPHSSSLSSSAVFRGGQSAPTPPATTLPSPLAAPAPVLRSLITSTTTTRPPSSNAIFSLTSSHMDESSNTVVDFSRLNSSGDLDGNGEGPAVVTFGFNDDDQPSPRMAKTSSDALHSRDDIHIHIPGPTGGGAGGGTIVNGRVAAAAGTYASGGGRQGGWLNLRYLLGLSTRANGESMGIGREPDSNMDGKRRSGQIPLRGDSPVPAASSHAHYRSASSSGNRGEIRYRVQSQKVKNKASEHWRDIIRIDASVIPSVLPPTLMLSAWSALVTVFYMVPGVNFLSGRIPNSSLLVTILGVVMGLLLVFRTNTSYDRFWEGRRIWSTVQAQVRNLARFIWVCVAAKTAEDQKLKRGAMNLVVGFAVACKNYLRGEASLHTDELWRLVQHLPAYAFSTSHLSLTVPGDTQSNSISVPLDLTLHLQSYINHCRRHDMVDIPTHGQMANSISSLTDSLSSFERIRSSPIPFAYSIHLKQTLLVYLISLPFQIAPSLLWATIPSVFIAAFTMLGIEAIGGQIENPFGYDPNDLPQDEYTDEIKNEIFLIMGEHFKYDSTTWLEPYKDISAPLVEVPGVHRPLA